MTIAKEEDNTDHELEHHDEGCQGVSAPGTDFEARDEKEHSGEDEDETASHE